MTSGAAEVVLAANKTARCAIVLAKSAIAPERTAAEELREYLGKVTGATFEVVAEGEEKPGAFVIAVGPTRHARELGIDAGLLAPEHWFMRTKGDRLVLVGGRPRGTLYAVYHFLEDVIGVHWWSVWEEHVPNTATLTIGALDRHDEPAFAMRGMDTANYYSRDTRFAARNRINFNYSFNIPFEYGGGNKFGPPRMCHTFCNYFWPTEALFKQHPDWFAMGKDGQRKRFESLQENQLCLSNPKLRKAFLAKLRENIRKSREDPVPPVYFDISANDSPHCCQCKACRAMAKEKGGSDAGLFLDFLNYLADNVKDEYPEVVIETLAYLNTEKPPKGVKARSNVAITLCDTRSNYLEPIPKEAYLAKLLKGWSRITDSIMIWDYHSSFLEPLAPLPIEHTFQPDLQLFRRYNVIGVKTEYHFPIDDELRDYRQWVLAKLYEDPYQDTETLTRTFLDGFYGPAAPHVGEYLRRLEQAARAKPATMRTQTKISALKYLDLPLIRKAQALFDEAAAAVTGSPTLARRVRHARMGVDKATVALFPKLVAQWAAAGAKPETIPFDREKIAARLQETYEEQWAIRVDPSEPSAHRREVRERRRKLIFDGIAAALKKKLIIVPPPSRFVKLPKGAWRHYPADSFGHYQKGTAVVEDPEAEGRLANRTVLSEDEVRKLPHPLRLDMHDYNKKATGREPSISAVKREDVPGPGYHWYKVGCYVVGPTSFLWIFGPGLELSLRDAFDPFNRGQKHDVWVCVKFEGPLFPHGKPGQENAICIERVVLVKVDE